MGINGSLADVLDYPTPDLARRVEACLQLAEPDDAGWADLLRFGETVRALTCDELQECYTAAFDFEPDCTLYVGHHLFGDDRRRAMFMSRLAGLYRDAGLAVDHGEAPDYLGAILRFVDRPAAAGERADLIADAVTPASERAARALERRRHPYASLLRAVAALTAAQVPRVVEKAAL